MKLEKGHLFFFITFTIGYGLLLVTDWKIALGIFLIHWYINVDMK